MLFSSRPISNGMNALSENRRARFDYEILETYEAGVELRGFEVKSAKAGRMQLVGSHAIIKGGEIWLLNSQIPPYQPKNTPKDYDPSRTRRLLLKKDEIKSLEGKLHQKSISLIPLKMYTKNNLVKMELGLARPKKKGDKRESLKKRAMDMEVRRELK